MSELGQLLKEARLEKSLSLDDVQEATKIRKRYLEAIEEGDYKVLPGSFYVRAFVKTYAEMVGLNLDEVVQDYCEDTLKPETDPIGPLVCMKRRSMQVSEQLSRWAPSLLKWGFVILSAAIIYSILVNYRHLETPDANILSKTNITEKQNLYAIPNGRTGVNLAEQGKEGARVVQQQQLEKPTAHEQQKPIILFENSKRSEDFYQVSAQNHEQVKVEIKAVGDRSWLEVYDKENKGNKLHYEILEKDQALTFDMSEQGLFIRAGYPKSIEIRVADQPLHKLDSDEPKNVRLQWLSYDEAQKLQMEGKVKVLEQQNS